MVPVILLKLTLFLGLRLRSVGYAECPGRIFSRSVNLDGQK